MEAGFLNKIQKNALNGFGILLLERSDLQFLVKSLKAVRINQWKDVGDVVVK